MPAPYGVTDEGFSAKTAEEAREELVAACQEAFGKNTNTDSRTPLGQLLDIWADQIGQQWEAQEAAYEGRDPAQAVGQSLYALGALTGTFPESEKPSTVPLYCCGDPATSLLTGRVASTIDLGTRFATIADATLAAATAWAATTAYVVGDIVTNDGGSGDFVYLCRVAGTSAGGSGPDQDIIGDTVVDGTVTWVSIGQGTALALVNSQSEELGPINGLQNTIKAIETPVTGWLSVYNDVDATLGNDTETDEEFRIRRVDELQSEEGAPINAVRETVLAVTGVDQAFVYQNVTNATDSFGLPPKSVEAVVDGGLDDDIADALLRSVAAGIEPFGSTVVPLVDDSGETQNIGFSRPTPIPITIAITVEVDTNTYPIDGDQQVEDALLATGTGYGIGEDVYSTALIPSAFTVQGVLNVSVLTVNGGASQSILRDEHATFAAVNITVTSVPGTP